MQWSEQAIILSVRKHGETSAIVEVLAREHGRALGLVHGARSKSMRPVLQPGNVVAAVWRARLDGQLGHFQLEPVTLRLARIIEDPVKLAALTSIAALLRHLPEREPHPRLYEATRLLLDSLEDNALWPALLVRWELGLLDELGFGLDLARCAATGAVVDLVYVSPRTGRAVSREAGEAWKERLLALPGFLMGGGAGAAEPSDIAAGFTLTGFFLERHLLAPRGESLPDSRAWVTARFT